jgi:hypothetical protein
MLFILEETDYGGKYTPRIDKFHNFLHGSSPKLTFAPGAVPIARTTLWSLGSRLQTAS